MSLPEHRKIQDFIPSSRPIWIKLILNKMYKNVERSVLVKYSLKDTLPRLVMCCIHLLIQVAGYEFVFIFSTLFCFLYFLTSTSIPHVLTHAHAHNVNILSFENAQKKSIFGGWRGVYWLSYQKSKFKSYTTQSFTVQCKIRFRLEYSCYIL